MLQVTKAYCARAAVLVVIALVAVMVNTPGHAQLRGTTQQSGSRVLEWVPFCLPKNPDFAKCASNLKRLAKGVDTARCIEDVPPDKVVTFSSCLSKRVSGKYFCPHRLHGLCKARQPGEESLVEQASTLAETFVASQRAVIFVGDSLLLQVADAFHCLLEEAISLIGRDEPSQQPRVQVIRASKGVANWEGFDNLKLFKRGDFLVLNEGVAYGIGDGGALHKSLVELRSKLLKVRSGRRGIVWVNTPVQHFDTTFGHFPSPFTSAKSKECVALRPIDSEQSRASRDFRVDASAKILSKVPGLLTYDAYAKTLNLHFEHPTSEASLLALDANTLLNLTVGRTWPTREAKRTGATVIDCTHYCGNFLGVPTMMALDLLEIFSRVIRRP